MEEGSGRGSGRVRLLVSNRGSGRVGSGPLSKVTRGQLWCISRLPIGGILAIYDIELLARLPEFKSESGPLFYATTRLGNRLNQGSISLRTHVTREFQYYY